MSRNSKASTAPKASGPKTRMASTRNRMPVGSLPFSTEMFARVGDLSGHGAGRNRHGRGEEDLRFLMAHPAGEVAVGGADAFHRRIHPAECVDRPAQASRATGVFRHLH